MFAVCPRHPRRRVYGISRVGHDHGPMSLNSDYQQRDVNKFHGFTVIRPRADDDFLTNCFTFLPYSYFHFKTRRSVMAKRGITEAGQSKLGTNLASQRFNFNNVERFGSNDPRQKPPVYSYYLCCRFVICPHNCDCFLT